ncbi:N5-carboxyaminoimidazole ribonucleotide synthase [Rubrobacter xylanophilus]|uniref:N5-carboxyaminoimidazole ribonucleotide synthase n=1 Tax=Rubrobacter xylanophilus TaxID=49319 RepID=A0A510HJN8_9ACTN|nr:5-(carboxyamino)imidazole ribonucleotide synthase [Rubrobacter xylanophilus]BBL80220.1 N5-carboxyaminoimidazole ribonucleotide synthase [Rubrobacter xylanophilus]
MSRTILPGSTIGVLGGGQLGRMLALAGGHMGYRFVVLDPTPDAPAGQVSGGQIVAPYGDREAARKLAAVSDVITYEFENVDAGVAQMLEREAYVPQGSRLLYTTQHRLREKRAVEGAGVPVAPYEPVRSEEDLRAALGRLGTPCVLKTATGGYDGKGQRVIRSESEARNAFSELSGAELVLERFIRFRKELSVIAARTPEGEVATFPPAENVHAQNILHLSIVPARIPEEVQEEARRMAVRVAEALGVVGLVAVEMFWAGGDELYVNELAPRPHNSGHYTIEACTTSQFEQHLRAVCGLPLAPTTLLTPAVMVNVLGQHLEPLIRLLSAGRLAASGGVVPKVHIYGKAEAKPGRKMGHVTLLAPDTGAALRWIERIGLWEAQGGAA